MALQFVTLSDLQTILGNLVTSLKSSIGIQPGSKGQIPFIQNNGSSVTKNEYILKKVNIVDSNTELTNAQSVVVNFADVFNKWARFSHNGTTNQPADSNEIQQWSYNSSTGKVLSTVNSGTYIGFVSSEKYGDYLHEATLSSTDGDDDFIAVIVAFATDSNGIQHTISAVRARCGKPLWQLVYDFNKSTGSVIAKVDKLAGDDVDGSVTNTSTTGWSLVPNGTRVKVDRQGDIIKVMCSPFNSTTYDQSSLLTVDLSSDPKFSIFRGPTQYGYACLSQASATFSNINFVGGTDTVIYDLSSGKVYVKQNNVWSVDITKNIAAEIGSGHFAYNQDTNKLYYVDESGAIKSLNSDIKNMNVKGTLYIENKSLQDTIDQRLRDLKLIN